MSITIKARQLLTLAALSLVAVTASAAPGCPGAQGRPLRSLTMFCRDGMTSLSYEVKRHTLGFGNPGTDCYEEITTASLIASDAAGQTVWSRELQPSEFVIKPRGNIPSDATFIDLRSHLVLECISPVPGGMSGSN